MAKKISKKKILSAIEIEKEREVARVENLKNHRVIVAELQATYGEQLPKISKYIADVIGLPVTVEITNYDGMTDIGNNESNQGFAIILPNNEGIGLNTFVAVKLTDVLEKTSNNIPIEQAILQCMFLELTNCSVCGIGIKDIDIQLKEYFSLLKNGILFGNNYSIEDDSLYELYQDNKQFIFNFIDVKDFSIYEDKVIVVAHSIKYVFNEDGIREYQIAVEDINTTDNMARFDIEAGYGVRYKL